MDGEFLLTLYEQKLLRTELFAALEDELSLSAEDRREYSDEWIGTTIYLIKRFGGEEEFRLWKQRNNRPELYLFE